MNTKKNIQEMIQLGVDNLATDFPVQAMEVRENFYKKR
jgi:glycerophosphoryl diester phosphodiesterase